MDNGREPIFKELMAKFFSRISERHLFTEQKAQKISSRTDKGTHTCTHYKENAAHQRS